MRPITKLNLTEEQEAELELIIKQDTRYRVRNRANAIIYKSKSYKVDEIAKILSVRPPTVYLWLREWGKEGVKSLYEKKGKGRRSILKMEDAEKIKALVINQPSLTIANARIREKLNICMHNMTLSRFLKKIKYSYTRVVKRPPKKPDKDLYEKKVTLLEKYEMLEERGKLDIYYFDESGFSISSNLPYLWSPMNQPSVVKTLVCKRINVLGFLSKQGDLKSYIADGRVNSDKVIEVFDSFVRTLSKPTIVVLDNASFHKSKRFKSNLARWSNKGLTLCYLPPYSPQLNIIETLWRFMKYVWIEYSAYLSWENLMEYIQRVFDRYGTYYRIDFNGYR